MPKSGSSVKCETLIELPGGARRIAYLTAESRTVFIRREAQRQVSAGYRSQARKALRLPVFL